MTLSTPVKIVVLAALALALGLGGLMLVFAKHSGAATTPATPVPAQPIVLHHAAAPAKPAPKPLAKPKPKIVLLPGIPGPIAASLRHHPIAVIAVYNSHTPGDRGALVSARAGARAAHAGFVAADVSHSAVANAIAIWASSPMNPAILVVKRPGTIAFGVAGPSDKDTVAQAVANAR
jgi:hypothetical protein